MKTVHLIHWHAGEAQERISTVEKAGYRVAFEPLKDQAALRRIREGEPDAILIDLDRMPSQGRDTAIWLRQQKPTRGVPLVFIGGAREKVEAIEKLLPDAVFTDWGRFRSALKRAIVNPPNQPVVPESAFAGYSGTPLPKKLGIKPGFVVALAGAPEGFDEMLGLLPEGAALRPSGRGKRNLTICFVRSCKELDRRLPAMFKASEQGHVWFAWPKKASGLKTDVTQNYVRQQGLAVGLVDFKICAIDETWSGLCFALRRKE